MVDGGGWAENEKDGRVGCGWDWQWDGMGKWRTAWQMWKDGGVKEGRELESEEAILSPDLETLLLINVNMHLTLGVEKLPA